VVDGAVELGHRRNRLQLAVVDDVRVDGGDGGGGVEGVGADRGRGGRRGLLRPNGGSGAGQHLQLLPPLLFLAVQLVGGGADERVSLGLATANRTGDVLADFGDEPLYVGAARLIGGADAMRMGVRSVEGEVISEPAPSRRHRGETRVCVRGEVICRQPEG